MKLTDLLDQFAQEKTIEKLTLQQYQLSVARLAEFIGHAPTLDDLTADVLNRWIMWLTDTKTFRCWTIRNHRSGVLRVWHYALELGLCESVPVKRIRRPKMEANIVRAWTLDDLAVLLDSAAKIEGTLNCGIPSHLFLTAWLWVGYETGFRPSDLRRLTWDNIDFEAATVTIIQHKTRGLHSAVIGPESLAALDSLRKFNQPLVFPLGKFGVRRWEEILFRHAAAHGFRRSKGQALGTLRKTHATEIYRQYGLAAAAESLGHRSGTTVARNHYIDSRQQLRHLAPSPRKRA